MRGEVQGYCNCAVCCNGDYAGPVQHIGSHPEFNSMNILVNGYANFQFMFSFDPCVYLVVLSNGNKRYMSFI